MVEKRQKLERRKNRARQKIRSVSSRNRLSVFKSGKHIHVQIIDDNASRTLVSASTLEKEFRQNNKSNCNIDSAKKIGKVIGERASKMAIKEVVFDKGGRSYHGVIKALADEARKELNF